MLFAGADSGGRTRRALPKIGKNMIFWRKIVILKLTTMHDITEILLKVVLRKP
jgi:hypothetical protein